MTTHTDITELLALAGDGNEAALRSLIQRTYKDLRRLAHKQLLGQRDQPTLNTTGLVHEWYVRLSEGGGFASNDREHFFRLAARIMRQVICAYARERLRDKRGGGQRPISLEEVEEKNIQHAKQMIDLDDALRDLAKSDPLLAEVVDCRFFAGLTEEETAAAMNISTRSVQRYWAQARDILTAST
jgi:RNA polymerase sigma factor (TIGR02999 family)